MTKENGLSRRSLILKAGAIAAGATAVSAGGLRLANGTGAGARYPWPYKKLYPEEVAEIAYENWYRNFCCYAVASGLLVPLREKVGEPYSSFPIESTRWGHGGAVGWGTLCGTLTGTGIVTGLTAGGVGEQILHDIISWYTRTKLPVFVPKKPKTEIKTVNTSASPLCHISVGKWMKKEGVGFFTPQRAERCARVSADVASRTARLLNEWKEGTYRPSRASQAKTHGMPAQNNCSDCHSG